MTYFIKRRPTVEPLPRAAMAGEFGEHRETIVVHPDEEESAYTGIVDHDGNAIHRQIKRPAGFVRFQVK